MFRQRCSIPTGFLVAGLAAALVYTGVVPPDSGMAQNGPEQRRRVQPPEASRDRDRDRTGENGRRVQPPERDRDRDRDARQQYRRDPQGTENGAPQLRLVPPGGPNGFPGPQWRLGVYADDTATGVRITRVVRNSPAWDAGLERGDQIVTVGGYQVGIVNGRYFPLGEELQRRAGRNGEVTLLVQNVRDGRLINVNVRLERER